MRHSLHNLSIQPQFPIQLNPRSLERSRVCVAQQYTERKYSLSLTRTVIMTTPPSRTIQYTSEELVESCGAILFDSQIQEVCLIHYIEKGEWLLAKGRRNCGESRHEAALRELREETGYQAKLHPVRMSTRAPPLDEKGHTPDQARSYQDLTEPFMMTMRRLGNEQEKNVKIIWWYIAALHEGVVPGSNESGEEKFKPEFFPLDVAVEKLSFDDDRKVLKKAIELANPQSIYSLSSVNKVVDGASS